MKTIKLNSILFITFSLLFLASCKDDENNDTETVNVMLEFSNKVGMNDLTLNQNQVAHDDTINFSLVRYYISKIRLYDDLDNEIAAYPDTYMLVKGEEANSISLGKLDVGQHVHKVKFNVGIDSTTNNQSESDFTSYPDDDPRAIQSPSMHWSWNTGYIFVKLEGTINSNELTLHTGMDKLLREAEVMIHENTMAGEMFHIKLETDLAMFLDSVQTNTDVVSQTMDNMPLAVDVMNNVSKVFSKAGDSGHSHGKK